MPFRHGIFLLMAALLCSVTSEQLSAQQGDPFWYPQNTQPMYPVFEEPHFQSQLVYPSQTFHFPHTVNPVLDSSYPQIIGDVVVPADIQTFPNAPPAIIHGQYPIEVIEAPVQVENMAPAELEPVLENGLDEGSDESESPSDMSIEELENQSQFDTGRKIIEIVGQIKGLEEEVARSVDATSARLDSLQETVVQSDDQIRQQVSQLENRIDQLIKEQQMTADKPKLPSVDNEELDELEKSRKKLKKRLEEKLKRQADQIDSLTTKLRKMEEANKANNSISQEAFKQLHADFRKMVEANESTKDRKSNKNAQANLDKKIEQIGKIIEREVQESIREHRERIIRNIIKQAADELRQRKDRRKDKSKDRYQDDHDDCQEDDRH